MNCDRYRAKFTICGKGLTTKQRKVGQFGDTRLFEDPIETALRSPQFPYS